MKKLLVVLAATGLATALTPAVAETGYDVWAAQSRAASPTQTASTGQTRATQPAATLSSGQVTAGISPALLQQLEPNSSASR